MATKVLTRRQRAALVSMRDCRTGAMGTRRDVCEDCGTVRLSHLSCGDRHCPQCQFTARQSWLAARRAELLPVPYFHGVFTLPHEYNALVPYNEKLLYELVFRTGADVLLAEGRRCYRGTLGLTALLHTWNQRLDRHVHVHFIIPAGALTDNGSWRPARNSRWLFDVHRMMRAFRTSLSRRLKNARSRGRLQLPPHLAHLAPKATFDAFVDTVAGKNWEVYLKPPFDGPEKVLEYTANYTHRVAIGNSRVKAIDHGRVTFSWRDRRNGGREELLCLPVDTFLDRLLMHILPHRFTKIRYFGFLAGGDRTTHLAQARAALHVESSDEPPRRADPLQLWEQATGEDLTVCPVCGGRMRIDPAPSALGRWHRATAPPPTTSHAQAA
jgi:hypothetical protein